VRGSVARCVFAMGVNIVAASPFLPYIHPDRVLHVGVLVASKAVCCMSFSAWLDVVCCLACSVWLWRMWARLGYRAPRASLNVMQSTESIVTLAAEQSPASQPYSTDSVMRAPRLPAAPVRPCAISG
jgi:hypothetical protein